MICLKNSLKKSILDIVSSAKEGLLLESQIDMVSNKHVTIQGYRGILEYEQEYVRIKLRDRSVIFYGNMLRLENLSDERIEIKGDISQIEYL